MPRVNELYTVECDLDKKFKSATVTHLLHAPTHLLAYRQHVLEREVRLAELQSETSQLAAQQLPGLIQDMAALQLSTVLRGDYSLKIARQDYFTSKQDKVADTFTLKVMCVL